MTLYQILTTYIVPQFCDLAQLDGYGENVFYKVFVWTISIALVHFFVSLPYMLLLKLCRYKGWFKR